MKAPLALLVHLGLLRTCFASNGTTCYYPNGNEAGLDSPCDPDAEVSVCCANAPYGNACLSNKLCLGPSGKSVRGSCTKKDWMSPDCPDFCTWNARGGGKDLVSCSNVTGHDTSFCCDGEPNCCDGGVGRFDLYPSNPHTWAKWVESSTRYVVLTPLSTSTSLPTTATTSDASLSTPGTAGTSTPAPTTPGVSASNQQTTESTGLSTGAKAGIGVGAAGGALLIAAVAILWRRLDKTKKMMAENPWPGAYPAQPGAAPYYPQHPGVKGELPAEQDMQELAGAMEHELAGCPAYSPVAHPRTAQ